MTETVVRQSPSVATMTSQVHASWRIPSETTSTETLSTPVEKRVTPNGSLYGNLSIGLFQNEPRKILLDRNLTSSSIHDETANSFETSDTTKEELASSSDDYFSDKAEIFSTSGINTSLQDTSPGIKWKTLSNSDEETSEGSDEVDEDTDEEDSNDKPGMSDMETKNLLEDAVEDEEESDLEDSNTLSSDMGRASKPIQDKTSSESLTDSLYGMSHEQRAYYTKCFNHLMKKTVGHYDINGAVCGANEHVVEFFKRSNLDREKLSKIWSLSDVNEDGYLDLHEFSAAMHLIVLHIKGHIPIPDVIPFEIRPPVMSRRDVPPHALDDGNCNLGIAPTTNVMHEWKQFDYDDASAPEHYAQQQHSFSDEYLYVPQPPNQNPPKRLSTFSDVPPLLVDGRPTALKATQPLICAISAGDGSSVTIPFATGPKGPPPKPPPRPTSKGHGRSASLDLNTFPCSTTPRLSRSFATEVQQRGATLPAQTSLRYHPCSSMPVDTVAMEWHAICCSPRHLPAPPLPPRSTFVDVSVQTDNCATSSRFADGHELIELNIDMEKRIEELLADEGNANTGIGCNNNGCGNTATTSSGHVNWRERCDHLRLLNAHLDTERAQLAQIRLQLELKLQELAGSQPSMKPTSL